VHHYIRVIRQLVESFEHLRVEAGHGVDNEELLASFILLPLLFFELFIVGLPCGYDSVGVFFSGQTRDDFSLLFADVYEVVDGEVQLRFVVADVR